MNNMNYDKRCVDCGAEIKNVGANRKRCDECRKIRITAQTKESRAKPEAQARQLMRSRAESDRMYSCGKKISCKLNEQRKIQDVICPTRIDKKISFTFWMPFNSSISKNARLGVSSNKYGNIRLYRKMENSELEKYIINKTAHLNGVIKQNKVWIDIFIEKPNNNSDAVNAVDTVCDAIKKAIGVDDRWFSLGKVDWIISKEETPRIFITVYQEDVWDARACSVCGRILPEECFHNKKQNRCAECSQKKYRFSKEELSKMAQKPTLPEEYREVNFDKKDEDYFIWHIIEERLYGEKDWTKHIGFTERNR